MQKKEVWPPVNIFTRSSAPGLHGVERSGGGHGCRIVAGKHSAGRAYLHVENGRRLRLCRVRRHCEGKMYIARAQHDRAFTAAWTQRTRSFRPPTLAAQYASICATSPCRCSRCASTEDRLLLWHCKDEMRCWTVHYYFSKALFRLNFLPRLSSAISVLPTWSSLLHEACIIPMPQVL